MPTMNQISWLLECLQIIMLGEHGITVETANDDMAGYYQKMEQAGKKEDNGIVSLADFMAVFFKRLRADR